MKELQKAMWYWCKLESCGLHA